MDDLMGVDWDTPAAKLQSPPQSTSTPSLPPLNPSPLSSLSRGPTPLSLQNSGASSSVPFRGIKKPSTPANDSFSSLLASNKSGKAADTLSLQERQQQLQREKEKQHWQLYGQFGAPDNALWDSLGSGRGTPAHATPRDLPPAQQPTAACSLSTTNKSFSAIDAPGQDDILAAFNAAAPVDTSSHYPVPQSPTSRKTTPSEIAPLGSNGKKSKGGNGVFLGDNDDVFERNQTTSTRSVQASASSDHDDDILGALGRPVLELSSAQLGPQCQSTKENPAHADGAAQSRSASDTAVAELVDMGFPADKAADALSRTSDGMDIQTAVAWLLDQAHEEAKQKTSRQIARNDSASESVPAWMRKQGRSRPGPQRPNESSIPAEENDMAHATHEFGAGILKSASSLWAQSQKKVQRAVADFQQRDTHATQPRWMRDAQGRVSSDGVPRRHQVTHEALMLESDKNRSNKPSHTTTVSQRATPLPRQEFDAKQHARIARLTQKDVEEESAQAYVSAARRKKTTPKPPEAAAPGPSSSSLSSSATLHPSNPLHPRKIPPASENALSTSAFHRKEGTESFKRGDYAAAHTAYTRALAHLPSGHPTAIVIFCNRALTNLKIGDPKAAVADADSALSTIGPSRGEGEQIAMGGSEDERDMKEFFGKGLMRKAEALEHLERWAAAADVWKEAVEAGVGGSVSMQSRNRCERAAGGGGPPQKSRPRAARHAAARPSSKPAAASDAGSGEAVQRLREANAAAEEADGERFSLTDQVDAKLVAWKGSKADNVRALLGSLDLVLWPNAGWNKVGMQDLVMPNRVKVVYMKAISKVHPDKIPQDATTEQRMISAAVFATLNEAWDKFRRDNHL